MKQHTTLRDYNYDLGSLFKDHKILKITDKGDKIQDETQPVALCINFLEIIHSYAWNQNMKTPNISELSMFSSLLLFIQEKFVERMVSR